MSPTIARLLTVLGAALLLAACEGDDGGPVAMVPSSFTDMTHEIDRARGTETEWIISGSSRLVRQLADGADADLLITADEATMRRAFDDGLVDVSLGTIAHNRLVLAVAPENPAGVDRLSDLADPDLLIGVCASEVPCGRLADEAATALGLTVAADTEEPNVRSLALKIARGELDAGLIYQTDALAFSLDTVDDDRLAGFVTAYVAASVHGDITGIAAFLRTPPGQELLVAAGFTIP